MPIQIEGEPREIRSTKNNLSPQEIGCMLNPIAGSLPDEFPFVSFYMLTLGIKHAYDRHKEVACRWNEAFERMRTTERVFVTRSIRAKFKTSGILTLGEIRWQLKHPESFKSNGLGKKGIELLSALFERTSQNDSSSVIE